MNLKETYGKKYRVTMDESFKAEKDTESRREEWRYHEIRGKYGVVFLYGRDLPAVTFTSSIVANRLKGRKWKVIQDGDGERTVLVPKEDLNYVFDAIIPRKRRHLNEAQKARAVERLKKWAFKSSSSA